MTKKSDHLIHNLENASAVNVIYSTERLEELIHVVTQLEEGQQRFKVHYTGSSYIVELLQDQIKPFDALSEASISSFSDHVLMLTHDGIGAEGTALSRTLISGYIRAMADQEPYPRLIILLNRGVLLAIEDSACLDALRLMESKGVLVLSNTTCVEYHKVIDQIAVGGLTNMYQIVELTKRARSVITF